MSNSHCGQDRVVIVTDTPFVALVEECIELRDVAQRVLSVPLGGKGLTRIEGLVLLSVVEADRLQTVSQVGRNIGHPRQVIQRAVNRLEELGLMTKEPNPHHKTSPLITPTTEGRKFEARMGERLVGTIGKALNAKDVAACLRIASELKALRYKIEMLADRAEE